MESISKIWPFCQMEWPSDGVPKDAQSLCGHFGLVNSLPIAIWNIFIGHEIHDLFSNYHDAPLTPLDVLVPGLRFNSSTSSRASAARALAWARWADKKGTRSSGT